MSEDLRIIAFYLPQFHPIKENDLWWGKGFTEWTNVTRATPVYDGHYQSHVPADLGFYDLRLAETRKQQAELAKEYGISGFCYYYYWFSGRRVLETPLDLVLQSGEPDFPFCICWANENWSRRWDGSESDILLKQEHNAATDEAFIRDVIPILRDPRYIRVDGAPLLMVYRIDLLQDPASTADSWRRICREEGITKLHLVAVQSFGIGDPRPYGFDAAVEFPPHGLKVGEMKSRVKNLDPEFRGFIFDYDRVVESAIARRLEEYTLYRGIFPSWDNSARKRFRAEIFHGASPDKYEFWLRTIIEYGRRNNPPDKQLIFINAWNEWAEGAHLEPDQKFGHRWLEATAKARRKPPNWLELLETLRDGELSSEERDKYFDELKSCFDDLQLSIQFLSKVKGLSEEYRQLKDTPAFSRASIGKICKGRVERAGSFNIDRVDGQNPAMIGSLTRHRPHQFIGWSFVDQIDPADRGTFSFVVMKDEKIDSYYICEIERRNMRDDVSAKFPEIKAAFTSKSGFQLSSSLAALPIGRYQVGFLTITDQRNVLQMSDILIDVT